MSTEGGTKAIVAALTANFGIAVTKFIAFLVSGSSSMLAESVHSLADSGNQVLLLVGGKRAKRAATSAHPFGYGRERYVYAFMVSIVLFSIGGVFSLYEGVHKLQHPEPIDAAWLPIAVLLIAIGLESFSLRTALKESADQRVGISVLTFVRRAKAPELPVVLLEDIAALVGLVLALIGVVLAVITGDGSWDGAGTVAIGVLLVIVALVLGVETKSLLLGEGASVVDVDDITAAGHQRSGGRRRHSHEVALPGSRRVAGGDEGGRQPGCDSRPDRGGHRRGRGADPGGGAGGQGDLRRAGSAEAGSSTDLVMPQAADPPSHPEQLPGMQLYRDVVVDRPLGYRPLLLDLLTPTGEGPFPLLVHIYGGGFAGGSHKTDALGSYLVERLVPEGFAVARVQYRHSKEAVFPAQVQDVKAAVRWLRQQAAATQLDPARFASWGSSSGGYLSAMLAVSAGHPLLEGDRGSSTSSAVQAAISWNGPVNIGRLPPPPPESPFHQLGEDPHEWLLGAPVSSAPALAAAASTSSYPTASAAPLMLVHGELDDGIPIDQSEELAAACRAAGAEVVLVPVPGAGHFFAGDDRERLVTQGIQFLRHHLR